MFRKDAVDFRLQGSKKIEMGQGAFLTASQVLNRVGRDLTHAMSTTQGGIERSTENVCERGSEQRDHEKQDALPS